MEGDGKATVYAGGWSDYRAQRGADAALGTAKTPLKSKRKTDAPAPKPTPKLSFTEKHRLAELPAEIAQLEAEIAKLEALMADPALFTREPVKFRKASEALVARQSALSAAEEDWLTLEEKAEISGSV